MRLRRIFPIRAAILWAGLACAGLACAALADDFGEACVYHRPHLEEASGAPPKFQRAGEVAVGALKIPAYSLSMEDGGLRSGGVSTYAPGKKGPRVKLKPELASQLEAYATPMGTILVPKGWRPRLAARGADGSFAIFFAPDAGGQSYMSVKNTAACVGCAYSSASWYFENARALARQDGFGYCRSAEGVHSVALNPFQRAYRIATGEGNPVDGLAYFDPGDDLMFYDVQFSAPAAQHALASAVLNQFVIPRRAK